MARNWQCPTPQSGEWVKGKLVGSGSFGTVHLAMNNITGALFVVKSAWSKDGFQSLENEANVLESLNSPHIVNCTGRYLLNGANGEKRLNLFMEYMAGGSLLDVAEKFGGVLDERVISLYTRQILLGLKHLHENGIVHCDLKCKNVLLDSFGNVKLADLGCAKRLSDLKKTNGTSKQPSKSIVGTPLWTAPEVLRNEGLDFAADIWSLGCTVIEMATGRPPWGDNISNPMAALVKIACSDETPHFPAEFSGEGLDFLAKCLERDPRKRSTTAELLNHPFVSNIGKGKGRSVREMEMETEGACSPASVLDAGIICEPGYESDESLEVEEGEFNPRTSSSINCCEERNQCPWEHQVGSLECDFCSSEEDWVTVRSSD
ncbi:mitogen-activated protein kinase kinase kinase 17-like [Diospyros lotus]|uniref:mitogen-activated protein kinase kinase kinase 17-like n=1 Tax=Diospyros lotus TaxID=55363 RepID=UPI00225979F0|nr:mitogen-activated protein kinase kinase kinase 17-like [Diospyros lotus]